ncbi:MAG: GAF domain-containing sensor histidine kinase [Candidatus Dormibacteria bacterium]
MPSVQVLATELLSSLEPREIILRLVQRALEIVPADRCTLTSLDQKVMRVEASHERGKGSPSWSGHEYPLLLLAQQPLLLEAVQSGRIATGTGFLVDRTQSEVAPDIGGMMRTAVVPLTLGDAVMAVLILSRRLDQEFGQDELVALQEIGVLAMLALRNARLYQSVNEAQERGLHALTLISQNLASSEELPAFFGRMSASVAQLVQAEKAAFWMLQDGVLRAQSEAHGFDPATLEQMHVDIGADEGGPLSRLLFAGAAIRGEFSQETLAGPRRALLQAMDVRDYVAVPWKTADQSLGLLLACNSATGFAAQDEWVMRVSARASAVVWQGYEAERKLISLQQREREHLEQHASRMAELEQLKSQFLRLASHELRTPLTIVRGYLSMFQEGVFGQLSDEAQKVLPTISSRVAEMNLLIDQMLNAARLEDSRLVVSVRDVRVDQVVQKVVTTFDGLRRTGQRLIVENPLGDLTVRADPEKLETIIANLVSNAIKYSPDGGDIRCVLEQHGGVAKISVSDQGVGIRDEDLARLFTRFGRLERPETANIEGTGLGLFLSRELARLQDGDITVESSLGHGSTFTLRLPLATAASAQGPAVK